MGKGAGRALLLSLGVCDIKKHATAFNGVAGRAVKQGLEYINDALGDIGKVPYIRIAWDCLDGKAQRAEGKNRGQFLKRRRL